MKSITSFLFGLTLVATFASCKKEETAPEASPMLKVKFQFNDQQERLDNLGNPASIPAGNAGITPQFNGMSTHYIELAPNMYTLLGEGEILYKGEETTAGGDVAVDFSKAKIGGENEVILEIPIKNITPGIYNWVRTSLTYQNYDIPFRHDTYDLVGTIGSFVGFNTYISNYQLKNESVSVNGNKKQGYWGFEVHSGQLPVQLPVYTGQAPEGATTVPNPLFATSPIPQGSCVVTGQFDGGFEITGNETADIEIILSVSIKNSFEFKDPNGNNVWEPNLGEDVVDMGVRGLIPIVK